MVEDCWLLDLVFLLKRELDDFFVLSFDNGDMLFEDNVIGDFVERNIMDVVKSK